MLLAIAMGPPLPSGFLSTERRRASMNPAVTADDHLVQAACGGDADAFAEIIARHKGRVFGMAAKYARNHHELEDLAQDVFIRVWRGITSWKGKAPFEHWLTKIAVRTCFDFLRRHRRRRESEVSRDALPEYCGLDAEASPEQAGENQALRLVRHALARLHPKEQLVLTLLELEDRTVREVSSLTGWSEGNVKVRAHRARASLRTAIEQIRRDGVPD
ncbi:MAG TPA: RNA polymerase sigma factor [Verrucomicrobiales bacterium]|jgi:RNA polymerase sigma-70 factor (ECF subfamily)|nr:RNA polymerase sigma factor [Verrucomicrobiales bacterium]